MKKLLKVYQSFSRGKQIAIAVLLVHLTLLFVLSFHHLITSRLKPPRPMIVKTVSAVLPAKEKSVSAQALPKKIAAPKKIAEPKPAKKVEANLSKIAELKPTKKVGANLSEIAEPKPTKKVGANLSEIAELKPTKKVEANLSKIAEPKPTKKVEANLSKIAEPKPTKKVGANLSEIAELKPTKKVEANLSEIAKSFEALGSDTKKKAPSTLAVPQKKASPPKEEEVIEDIRYEELLIAFLQESLDLPEFGPVRLKLEIDRFGKLIDCQILEAKSMKNAAFLKNRLPELAFPCLNGLGKISATQTFNITFRNVETR